METETETVCTEANLKSEIRKKFQKIRAEIPAEERRTAERLIKERLFRTKLYGDAQQIYCYASFREEADTFAIIKESLERGKKTALPRITGKRKMTFFYIRKMDDLRPGAWGIPEPAEWCEEAPKPGEETLVIMPGLAFDWNGNRVGYGGGYYDRYLADCLTCRRAALAFSVQCTQEIPSRRHDVCPEIIITEKELIECLQDCREIR